MNYKFVKHNLEGNYSVLSRVLTFNFEIGRASIDYGFHKFYDAHFQRGAAISCNQN